MAPRTPQDKWLLDITAILVPDYHLQYPHLGTTEMPESEDNPFSAHENDSKAPGCEKQCLDCELHHNISLNRWVNSQWTAASMAAHWWQLAREGGHHHLDGKTRVRLQMVQWNPHGRTKWNKKQIHEFSTPLALHKASASLLLDESKSIILYWSK